MKVYYLNADTLESLRNKITENLQFYKNGELSFIKAPNLIRDSKLNIEDFKFDVSKTNPDDTDLENIKRFYTAFKILKEGQASEESLWAGLCHYEPFWKYLKYRWNCESEEEILTRYFFGKDRPKFSNALARLWWYGRMTYDGKAENPFELTEYICSGNLTLKGLLPLTFSFSNSIRVYQTYIRTLMNFEKKHKLKQEDHEKIRRKMQFLGGKILLDSLSEEELKNKIEDYLKEIIKK